jgi:hypothetical protein
VLRALPSLGNSLLCSAVQLPSGPTSCTLLSALGGDIPTSVPAVATVHPGFCIAVSLSYLLPLVSISTPKVLKFQQFLEPKKTWGRVVNILSLSL